MHTHPKETPTSGSNHMAGVNTKNPAIVRVTGQQVNRLASYAARAARKGHTVQKLGSGYIVSRWGHVIYCADLEAVDRRLQRMGI